MFEHGFYRFESFEIVLNSKPFKPIQSLFKVGLSIILSNMFILVPGSHQFKLVTVGRIRKFTS